MKKEIIPAIIGAAGTIVASLLGAQWLFQSNVKQLSFSTDSAYETKMPKTPYISKDSGFVLVTVSAHAPELPMVQAIGKVGGEVVAGTTAHDEENQATGSVSTTSFIMPVPKEAAWIVDIPIGAEKAVTVKWFSFHADLDRKSSK